MHDVASLYFGHYASNVFDFNTGICWYCDDANITEINDMLEGFFTRESQKQPNKKENYVRL